MNIHNQVCSLELATRLKELGVKQDAYFYWVPACYGKWRLLKPNVLYRKGTKAISAFSVAELGNLLPVLCGSGKQRSNEWICHNTIEGLDVLKSFSSETEADARAMMLIHLIENNLWNPKA